MRGISPKNYDLRQQMVETHLLPRGISDPQVLAAFRKIPRELFVPPEYQKLAYIDSPLQIGEGQTISQPFTVAMMTQLLKLTPTDKVLEIGSGSGYQAAILAEIANQGEIYSIECIEKLSKQARKNLQQLDDQNITLVVEDGTRGLPEHAPFDAIIVTAGAPHVPQPLVDQLTENGRLVIPIGNSTFQQMTRITKLPDGQIKEETFGDYCFVPLIGKYGWQKDN